MGDLTDEEILYRALQIMYKRESSEPGTHFAPCEPVRTNNNCNSCPNQYPEYQVMDNNSICNCEECQVVVYSESFCSCCCEPYISTPNVTKTGNVIMETKAVVIEEVIDLTLSDNEDNQDKEYATNILPKDGHQDETVVFEKNCAAQTLRGSQRQQLQNSSETQDDDHRKHKHKKAENREDEKGWSSDGSGEFDLHLEFEKVKKLKKKRKNDQQSLVKDFTKPCKRRKVESQHSCKKLRRRIRDKVDHDKLHDSSFLPRRCRNKTEGKQQDTPIPVDNSDNFETVMSNDRLGLNQGLVPSPACLDGLSELEKLATFTVSQLYPQTSTDSNGQSLLQSVYPSGSKNQHTGGVLNDILNKTRLRSKVKL